MAAFGTVELSSFFPDRINSPAEVLMCDCDAAQKYSRNETYLGFS